MRRSLTVPIRTMLENEFRSLAHVRSKSTGNFVGPHLQDAATKKMRADIGALLSQLPRPRAELADGSPNRYVVRLTRVSPGQADGHDGLRGGTMKAVVDAVAEWIGVDDGNHRIRWEYEQAGCPLRMFALRIEVECLEPGVDVVIERGNLPARITQAHPRGSVRPKPQRVARDQSEILFRECWGVLPHEQDGGDPVLTPLAMNGDDPPKQIAVRVPAVVLSGAASVRFAPGSTITLERSLGRVDGREAWVYLLPDASVWQLDGREL